VIPADLQVELAAAISELVAAGHLPAGAVGLSAAGTWRPAPASLVLVNVTAVSPAAVSPAAATPAAATPAAATPAAATPAAVSPAAVSPAAVSPAAASPAPAGAARGAAASYATSLPFELARMTGEEPAALAARLGQVVRRVGWITSAEATGAGYLTIGVTPAALAAVAVRISQAGPACASSEALRGIGRPAPPLPDLGVAVNWRQAWRDQASALAGRLALAAGATARPSGAEPPRGTGGTGGITGGTGGTGGTTGTGDAPIAAAAAGATARPSGGTLTGGPSGGGAPGGSGAPGSGAPGSGATVAAAVAYAGVDAVRYWLARMPAARAGVLDRPLSLARDPARPRAAPPFPAAPFPAPPFPAPPDLARDLDAVAFARADAAATARWAAELGLARREPLGAGQLAQPAEITLLTQLSWLAERVAGAARRGQPAELPRYLERLAGAWLDVRESCPALPFGGRDAPGDAAGISARLWLAQATATALTAGLDLVGVRP
jgi:hypothetical protein